VPASDCTPDRVSQICLGLPVPSAAPGWPARAATVQSIIRFAPRNTKEPAGLRATVRADLVVV